MEMNRLNLIKQWVQSKKSVTPLLISSVDAQLLHETVDKILAWAKEKGIVHQTDVIRCEPIKNTIAIKTVRQILAKSAFAPLAQSRIIIFDQAEKLSLPAANALLKSLEDTPASIRYLLTTRARRSILLTILSRCQKISLPSCLKSTIDRAHIENRLQQTLLARLSEAQHIEDTELMAIAVALGDLLRAQGPTRQLKNAMARLRDYYKIKSIKGNEKLAKDVFLASL